jgi:hypothetical protein
MYLFIYAIGSPNCAGARTFKLYKPVPTDMDM